MSQRQLQAALSEHWIDVAGFLVSAILGAVFLWLITPEGFILGVSSYWQTQLEDIAQYLSGYRAFMSAPWSIPLLSIPSINWPTGTTVSFVDAIPTFSLGVKLVDPILPIPHNPLGIWVLFCFAMQGGAAWILARQIVGRNFLLVGLGVILCIMMPSLSARMGHLSLQAHFIILLALALYFNGRNTGQLRILSWTLLLLFSFYTNFYLAAMATAVMMAAMADASLKSRRLWTAAAAAIPIAVVGLSVPLMLGTAFGSAVPDTGFGHYSMNLLSPIGHGYLLKLPFYVPGTSGQYEGYNYLGLGVIILLGWTVLSRARRPGRTERIFGPFFVGVLALCTVYALSNEVYLSDIHLLSWDVPAALLSLFESFRSSGRFFWVVSYALIAIVLIFLGRLGRPQQLVMATAILALQVADLAPTYRDIHASLEREPNIVADQSQWDAALKGVSTIHAFPKFKCPGGYAREVLPLQMVAANGGYNLTTGFISRYGADCDAVAAEIAGSDPETSAYVFANTH